MMMAVMKNYHSINRSIVNERKKRERVRNKNKCVTKATEENVIEIHQVWRGKCCMFSLIILICS